MPEKVSFWARFKGWSGHLRHFNFFDLKEAELKSCRVTVESSFVLGCEVVELFELRLFLWLFLDVGKVFVVCFSFKGLSSCCDSKLNPRFSKLRCVVAKLLFCSLTCVFLYVEILVKLEGKCLLFSMLSCMRIFTVVNMVS